MTQITRLLRIVSSYVEYRPEKPCRSSYKRLNSTFDGSKVSETRAFSSLEGGGENSSEYAPLLSCDSLSYPQSCDTDICKSEEVSHYLDNVVIGGPKTPPSAAPPVGCGRSGFHANETAGCFIRHSWDGSFVIGNGYTSVAR